MQKITYRLIGPRAGENAGKTFAKFSAFGIEDFYRGMRFDGWTREEIEILKTEDATPEEIAAEESRNEYFERFGTACE